MSQNSAVTSVASESSGTQQSPDVDVVVVGAGFAGLYLLHRLRGLGLSAMCFEQADGVGGTWYWNRYPGARCDVESIDYSYSFDAELDAEWRWSERYATQPEILRYLEMVADRFDLTSDIQFSTKVVSAAWDDGNSLWRLSTSDGGTTTCRFYVMASGCLSQPKTPDIEGQQTFAGEVYYTSRWPHEGVDFSGKRVGLIGTGSSAIQSIPIIAAQASQLTVFQRTPNFSIPAHNGPHPQAKLDRIDADRAGYREAAKWSGAGVPVEPSVVGALTVSDEERNRLYEEAWAAGGLFATLNIFNDIGVNKAANDTLAEFIRNKIRATVDDPATAEALCPTNHPFGTKRPCLDDDYYATYNLPHASLVDLRADPITRITPGGVETTSATFEFDALVFATGFDAMTGAIVAVDITGRDGVTLADKWAEGPKTYLGLTTVGFPNFFTITGPGSPSVLSNMVVSIEQHVDWICDALEHLSASEMTTIEPTTTAEEGWVDHVNKFGDITLFPQADSWYMGANVPGKPRVFLPYVGGVDTYRRICDQVADRDYLGFAFSNGDEQRCNDGVICELQPDVMLMLHAMSLMDLPPLESMTPDEARAFMSEANTMRPPGPDVGEIVDGTYPAADGSDLAYRLYRPDSPGPHPVVLYFHGGGWVLGDAVSDDPLCRDLCVRSNAIIVSVDYRHGPEARFPAAADDAYAALTWLSAQAPSLGGTSGPVVVAGWSAGGNLAVVVSRTTRELNGPEIAGQVLLTPVTDGTARWPSMESNADGFVLTAPLMDWFWDHYADPEQRSDPKASPLRAATLEGLPPALIVTAEFDPLRDEGDAYADALLSAGVKVEHIQALGHTHTSIPAVDLLATGAPIRESMAAAISTFLKTKRKAG